MFSPANHAIAIHFNAFTGKLEGGYVFDWHTKPTFNPDGTMSGRVAMIGGYQHPAAVLALMAAHPDARCVPMKA